jgi:CDK inhibitor PHO81
MLPPTTGLCIELAACTSPSTPPRAQQALDVNLFVDSVLRTVYSTVETAGRRRILFTSFAPDVCAALNWKQPNCATVKPC